jgi:hypothetical protein
MYQPVVSNLLMCRSDRAIEWFISFISDRGVLSNLRLMFCNQLLLTDYLCSNLMIKSSPPIIANQLVRSNLRLKVLYPDCIATFRGLISNQSRNLQTRHFCQIFYPPIARLKNSWYVIANESLDSDMCGLLFKTRTFLPNFLSPNREIEEFLICYC